MPDPTPPVTPTPTVVTPPQGEPVAGDKPLGENGEKALKAERDARKAAELSATKLQKQLDEIAAANLSDLEKAQKEAKDARDDATKATSDALRYRIASETGITENVDLILTASDEDTMRKQAALWDGRTPAPVAGPRPDLSQGGSGEAAASDPATAFADFIQKM
jgi:hypothetical protein